MGWLLAIGAIVLAIYSRGFRLVAAGVIIVGALVIAYSIASSNNTREAAKRLIHVPPGQARDVSDHVFFSHPPRIRGRMEWSYVIDATYGEN